MADDRAALDLSAPRRIHVTNAAGAGMSAVAVLLAQMGHRVSGHDPSTTSPFLIRLRELDVPVTAGAEGSLPADADAVVVSTATPADHPDVAAARARGIPVVHRSGAVRWGSSFLPLKPMCHFPVVRLSCRGVRWRSTTTGSIR